MITPAPLAISGQNRAFPVIFHIKAISSLFLGAAQATAAATTIFFHSGLKLKTKKNLNLFPSISYICVLWCCTFNWWFGPHHTFACLLHLSIYSQKMCALRTGHLLIHYLIKVIEKLQGVAWFHCNYNWFTPRRLACCNTHAIRLNDKRHPILLATLTNVLWSKNSPHILKVTQRMRDWNKCPFSPLKPKQEKLLTILIWFMLPMDA